ncbi:retrovirus-related Pol polyprotein from transposon 17.6 [Trichonephila clavipes]|nr:retrovirus-related Pol polyprotein from transposon 17.6 [Trichonephila clavipes]
MEESSKKNTSFVTHNGQYEFNEVPFGLCNSPSIFQRFINHVFRDLLKEGIVIIYMDDIIIPSCGRGSRVVWASDRGWLCHEFEPSTTKDPPCRAAMHAKSVES